MMNKTVLIVDDDQNLVAPLKEGLESMGYRVAVAFDGLQGIMQAHQSKPDAILLDYHMPGGNGDLVYERLRQTSVTASTPIIFSTVAPMEEVKGRIRPSPQTFFLKKPVGLRDMVAVINRVLGTEPPAPVGAPAPFAAVPAPAPQVRAAAPAPRRVRIARVHDHTLRIPYADTDAVGLVYYANYLKYFEAARTELLRSLGVRWRDLEAARGLFLPAVEAGCKYLAPCRYDDLLLVRTWIPELRAVTIRFEHEIVSAEGRQQLVARGFSRHALLGRDWRPERVPADIKILLEPFVGTPA